MAHANRRTSLVTLVSALALAVIGCAAHVETGNGTSAEGQGGGGGGGTGGSGGGGEGGAAACSAYTGDGCTPGAQQGCGVEYGTQLYAVCELVTPNGCATQWNSADCNTPLVLSFDGAPVQYLADEAHGFQLAGSRSQVTDWPRAATPWLALDRDGDGRIADGSELFGSLTVLSSGARAPHGFAALRELDANGDGRLTVADPAFARLLVWSDRDGDRRSTPEELSPASAWELVSIDLDYTVDPRCDARGNCEVERAAFRYRDASGVERTGAVVDVHLAAQR